MCNDMERRERDRQCWESGCVPCHWAMGERQAVVAQGLGVMIECDGRETGSDVRWTGSDETGTLCHDIERRERDRQ